jgi:hypothetical protein
MRYADASWHRPYGSSGASEEALGFGHGDGAVSGEIEGDLVWANYPRRREDGVWTPAQNRRSGIASTAPPMGDSRFVISRRAANLRHRGPGGKRDGRSRPTVIAWDSEEDGPPRDSAGEEIELAMSVVMGLQDRPHGLKEIRCASRRCAGS